MAYVPSAQIFGVGSDNIAWVYLDADPRTVGIHDAIPWLLGGPRLHRLPGMDSNGRHSQEATG